MEAYAVLETGGKQYRVTPGMKLQVERLFLADGAIADAGSEIELTTVLAMSDGKEIKIGMPYVEGAKVVLTVDGQIRGKKVINFKQKRRKGYARTVGHRQELTAVTVKSIA